ncbi:hypothetical protein B0T14DRAFT_511200 [Immersiella caudata]|uniref:Uncharacterized protein n=1 Tax=Immersiella caudata TaxID=314043 RepID=A0AA39X3Z4_9PEZI|nr:hypothetical protein B0T14DRAFT_511200 [Immersiella caudata]
MVHRPNCCPLSLTEHRLASASCDIAAGAQPFFLPPPHNPSIPLKPTSTQKTYLKSTSPFQPRAKSNPAIFFFPLRLYLTLALTIWESHEPDLCFAFQNGPIVTLAPQQSCDHSQWRVRRDLTARGTSPSVMPFYLSLASGLIEC